MVDLYLHFLIRLHCVMLNQLSTGRTLLPSVPPDELIVCSGDNTRAVGSVLPATALLWCDFLPEAADHHVPGAKQKNRSMFRVRDTLLGAPE
jgi:hypothetical protein